MPLNPALQQEMDAALLPMFGETITEAMRQAGYAETHRPTVVRDAPEPLG